MKYTEIVIHDSDYGKFLDKIAHKESQGFERYGDEHWEDPENGFSMIIYQSMIKHWY